MTQTKQQPKQPVQLKLEQEVKSKQCSPSKERFVDDFNQNTNKNSMSKMELVISMTAFCMVTGPVYFVIWGLKHFHVIE